MTAQMSRQTQKDGKRFHSNSVRNRVTIHTADTHTQTHTRSDEVGSDSRRLMQLAEMMWVLKVLNTIILFYPSLDLSLSSH